MGDTEVTNADRLVAGQLMHNARHSEGGRAWPSQQAIADAFGICRATA